MFSRKKKKSNGDASADAVSAASVSSSSNSTPPPTPPRHRASTKYYDTDAESQTTVEKQNEIDELGHRLAKFKTSAGSTFSSSFVSTSSSSSQAEAEAEDEEDDVDNEVFDSDEEYDPSSSSSSAFSLNSHKKSIPVPAPWGSWTESDTRPLVIRGRTFLDDKIKIPCGPAIYRLAWCDMFRNLNGERCPHVAARPESYAFLFHQARLNKKRALAAAAHAANPTSSTAAPEEVEELPVDVNSSAFLSPMIVINFMFAGPEGHYNIVLYMVRHIRPADSLERHRERKAAAKRNAAATSSSSAGASASRSNGCGANSNPASPQISPAPQGADSPVQRTRKMSSSGRMNPSVSFSGYGSESDLHLPPSHPTTSPSLAPSNSSNNPDSIDIERVRAFDRVMRIFLQGDDQERNSRIKIIPRIAEGSWIVRKGVGQTPAILGRKVNQTYHRDPVRNYLEVDVDVGSSVVAGKILSLVKSAAQSLVIELTFLFQGEKEEELPESIIQGISIIHPSLENTIPYMDNYNETKALMTFPF